MRRLFLLFLILLGVYIAYPYWTLLRVEQALLTDNAERLEKFVDFPAIRAGMKKQVEGGLIEKSQKLGEKRPLLGDIGEALTRALGPSVVGGTVDSLVTPETILNNPTVVEHREKDEGFRDFLTYAFFASPTRFTVDVKDPKRADAPTVTGTLTLNGIRWRLTHIELPPLNSLTPNPLTPKID